MFGESLITSERQLLAKPHWCIHQKKPFVSSIQPIACVVWIQTHLFDSYYKQNAQDVPTEKSDFQSL